MLLQFRGFLGLYVQLSVNPITARASYTDPEHFQHTPDEDDEDENHGPENDNPPPVRAVVYCIHVHPEQGLFGRISDSKDGNVRGEITATNTNGRNMNYRSH